MKNKIVYFFTILASVSFIFLGNRYVSKKIVVNKNDNEPSYYKAEVTEILREILVEQVINSETGESLHGVDVVFKARILNSSEKGQVVSAVKKYSFMITDLTKDVQVGDKVVLIKNNFNIGEASQDDSFLHSDTDSYQYYFTEYVRTDRLIILGAIFFVLILLFGRLKGFNTIVSLVFTVLAVFMVFIPSIIAGYNIYISSVVVCIFTVVMTLLIVNGPNFKSLSACLGCFGGLLIASTLVFVMDRALFLTGMVDDKSQFLLNLSEGVSLDLKAIVFASIIIGAIGAVMDVAVDIASSLNEIATKLAKPSFRELCASGFNIGRDILGTMANTLVLAYIGSSLSTVLLLVASNISLLSLFNMEMIVVEILQAIVGSIALLATIPITSIIASILFSNHYRKNIAEQDEEVEYLTDRKNGGMNNELNLYNDKNFK